MELFFNEISALYRETDRYGAKERMENLLALCTRARAEGFRSLRTDRQFDSFELAEGYRVWDWYGDPTVSITLKSFFLGFRKFPYETGEERTEDDFLSATYRLNEPDESRYHGAVTAGLAWAHIWGTLCISFPANDVWKRSRIRLWQEIMEVVSVVAVPHASDPAHVAFHHEWISSIREPVLVETDLSPDAKEISLRDDHGKERLSAFAKKLVMSPFVKGVINSLPYNPNTRNFIRKVWPDGRIEMVMIWTDQGLGLVVQTTGRNLRETEAIGSILKESYS